MPTAGYAYAFAVFSVAVDERCDRVIPESLTAAINLLFYGNSKK
ncbi:hypothetical protein [Nostoc sp. 'Peltigera membranacea cyanobiont' 210A]|nr:hypothetical protein [Nostoc sp. 'Peltigera membranacea cyanobiont' 210A]